MKYYICVLLLFILFACNKEDDYIPGMEIGFKTYMLENFDLDGDGLISPEEAALITEIDCSDRNIYSLNAIQDLPNLEVLICNNIKTHAIDVSKNGKLKTLICDGNDLIKIDVSNNPLLETLSCKNGGALDTVVLNTGLIKLDIRGHLMDTVDLSQNRSLKELYCGGPNLSILDISASVIEVLDCSDAKLTEFNMEGCSSLKSLTIDAEGLILELGNCPNLEELYIQSTENLDVSHSPLLKTLYCVNSKFVGMDLAKNPLLENLRLEGTNQELIDLSKNLQLINVELFIPIRVRSLDMSNRTTLKSFSYREWGEGGLTLETLNLSECTSLENLNLEYIKLTSLNVSGCNKLSTLKCYDSRLAELNIKGCTNISVLDCRGNALTELELGDCTKLTELNCSGNKLTSLKINSANLTILNCVSNQITELNVRDQTRLEELYCNDNQIAAIDLTGCTSLVELDCRNMPALASLILTNCRSLEILYCTNASLSKLDVSSCTALKNLYCAANHLQPSLDVSKCMKLIELNCISNPGLTELILNREQVIDPLYKDSQTQIVLVN